MDLLHFPFPVRLININKSLIFNQIIANQNNHVKKHPKHPKNVNLA